MTTWAEIILECRFHPKETRATYSFPDDCEGWPTCKICGKDLKIAYKGTKLDLEILEKLPRGEWFCWDTEGIFSIKRSEYRLKRLYELGYLERESRFISEDSREWEWFYKVKEYWE
jgi:hypothetical protein